MKNTVAFLFCIFFYIIGYGQRVTYINAAQDSVQIDFGIAHNQYRYYKSRDVQVFAGYDVYPSLNKSADGFIAVVIPKKLFIDNKGNLTIKVYHKTQKSKDFVLPVKTKEICTGFCHPQIFRIDEGNSDRTRTITSEELEKGAY